ncbi:MAG: DUF1071 domain-containing protein [Bacteroidales bacterium]|nr:DUF1071 domain-containing protein [Bacteroidales bacterium]
MEGTKENKTVFEILNNVNLKEKTKEKGGLNYLSWSSAWAEVKKKYPDATYEIIPQIIDDSGNTRFWHDDGKTGWVEVRVTIGNISHTEVLAIMDFKNKSIAAENITSVDANKSMKRCLVKACAMHGLGLYIYEGEDLPEDISKSIELKESIAELAKKKVAFSDKAKEKVAELCKAAEKEANPNMDDELITGNYKNIDDVEILTKLEKQLLAIRK